MSLLSQMKKLTEDWMHNSGYFTPAMKGKLHELISLMGASLPESRVTTEMTYAEVIEYFVKSHPHQPSVDKGAVIRQHLSVGTQLVQVFLDKDNNLICKPDGRPYGRRLVVKRLDQELCDCFGSTDLIIVE